MTLDEKLKEIEGWVHSYPYHHDLLAALQKAREQRNYEHNCLVTVEECEEMDAYDLELLSILNGQNILENGGGE